MTTRPHSPALDAMLGEAIPVLDHGFVRVIDYMGDDSAVVQSARVSYGEGTKTVSDDAALIRYLMRHRHTTPTEMCEIKLHIRAPIFVARQWMRHRTGSFNEVSARYSVLPREFYVPEASELRSQSTANKQGGDAPFPDSETVLQIMREMSDASHTEYEECLESGVSREQARIILPLNTYTEWYWKVDLHNLFNFLSLRADPHAQYEIRVYADAIMDIVDKWCPVSAQAFRDYRLNATSLSAQALATVRRMVVGLPVDQRSSGMGLREWTGLMDAMGLNK